MISLSDFAPAEILAWSEAELESAVLDPPVLALWTPRGTTAVLGLSQDPGAELDVERIRRDGVGVMRRQSGGGAVLLYEGVLCWEALASAAWLAAPSGREAGIGECYGLLSEPIVRGLGELGVAVSRAGISDLAARCGATGEARKVAGTAQLRRRGKVLVHGSLLVDADLERLGAYLRLPSVRPEYRGERRHEEFCVNVARLLPVASANSVALVADVVVRAALGIGWRVVRPPSELSGAAARLKAEKYDAREWNWLKVRPKTS